MERGNSTKQQPEGAAFTTKPKEQATPPASISRLTEWQRFFLERLDYMLELQRENRAPDEASGTLLSKSVYSTYLDCQAQGVGEEALQRLGASGATGAPSTN
jgi:hypothetical protein